MLSLSGVDSLMSLSILRVLQERMAPTILRDFISENMSLEDLEIALVPLPKRLLQKMLLQRQSQAWPRA